MLGRRVLLQLVDLEGEGLREAGQDLRMRAGNPENQ
jgi:hypothetical protein